MIEPYEDTIDGIAYRITFDVEDLDVDGFEGTQTYPALVWRKDDAGAWRILFDEDGQLTKEETIAVCLVRLKAHLF